MVLGIFVDILACASNRWWEETVSVPKVEQWHEVRAADDNFGVKEAKGLPRFVWDKTDLR